ncbi:MAG: YitT family protein [Lachnospiraceae bacterium]|nr:YitT family protein [Lachnospiraceae bacterium]
MRSGIKNDFISILTIVFGAAVAAFSIEEFLSPNRIFDGGITGVSMILTSKLELNLGLMVIILNIPFLIAALKNLGKKFVIKTVTAMAVFSITLGFFEPLQRITDDSLLATVFGGVVLGIGVGLVLRGGGCLDGTEIVGIFVSRKTSLSVGRVVLIINVVIYLIAGLTFGIESGLYSMLMYFITSKVIDIVELGLEQAKAVMIITDHGEEVAEDIYEKLGRTVTFIRGEGLVSGTNKDVLYCVVTRAEIADVRSLVRDMDYSAFTTITDVSEIIGTHIKRSAASVIAELDKDDGDKAEENFMEKQEDEADE